MFNLTKSFNKTIMRKKLLFRSWLLLALMLVGAGSAWAKTKVGETTNTLYERGSSTAWAVADLDEWVMAHTVNAPTATIDGAFKVSCANGGWTYTKSLSVSEDAVVSMTASISTGGAPSRPTSYDYLKIGGVSFRFNDNTQKASVDIDGTTTELGITYTRSGTYEIEVSINTLTGAVSYTVAGESGTGTSTTAISSVVYGHNRGGSESTTAQTRSLNSINVTEVAPVYSSENIAKTWDFTTWSDTYPTTDYQNYATVSSATNLSGLELENAGDTRFYTRTDGSGYIQLLGGTIKVPVTQGQIVTFYVQSIDSHQAIYPVGGNIDNPGDIALVYAEEKVVGYTANADGYITITSSNNYCRINKITLENAPDVYFTSSTCSAELIALDINEPTLVCPEEAEVTYSVSNEKIAKLGGEAHSGDLMGVNTGVTTVTATVNYKGSTYTVSYNLTISADEATYVVDGNTYTLTGPGKLGERVVNLVPKITTEFGENTEGVTNITIVRDEAGIGPVATTLDSNGWRQLWYDGSTGFVQPVQGSFYTFKPTANGHLTVKGYLSGANSVYLVNSQNLAHVPSDVTAQVAKDGTYWRGTGNAALNFAPGVEIGGTTYPMAESYNGSTVTVIGNILSQTVSGLANGRYTVVLQANACFTEGRQIKGADGQDYVWDASIANDIANVFVESGGVRQTQAVTALNAGSVSSNGRFEFEVEVTDGTLTMGMNKTQQGTNWHTIQIESLNYLDATDSHFEPVAQYVPGAGFADNSEVDIEADLEAGQTYYLYANIPSSNGVNTWATYQLQAFTYESAWHFAEKSVVTTEASYAGMEVVSLTSATPSLTYSIEPKGDVTATIDANTGAISNISGEGGALVVTATDGTDSDYYVVTVPYANKVWDFWGLNGTRKYPSDLMEEDFDWAMNYELRNYDTTTRNLYYLNEPILTAAQAVAGDNAAFIGETAGIVMNANAKTFGLRANVTGLTTYDNFKAFFLDGGENQAKYANFIEDYNLNSDEFTAEKFEELKADGAFVDKYLKVMLAYTDADLIKTDAQPNGTNIAAMTKGATMVIPHVKAGSHIAIKWYRHAPGDGDHILLTNAVDLDGNAITNGVYVVNQGRGNDIFSNPYGWIEFKAAGNEGEYVDVTLTCEKGWTHMKAVALSEEFYDTNLRVTNNGANSAHKTVFDTTDGADSNTYSTNASYTFSENGVTYAYTLEDITGNIEGNYTINGGEISFNQGTQGTATLVLTAFSNGYAIDREWLPIKVGAYGDTHQDYPYTWNFTNINTGNLDGEDNWTKDGDNYTVTPAATTAHLQDNELKKNSTDEAGVAEFDELGIETPTNTDGTPTAIDLTITDNGNSTTTTVGDEGITFVVPDVPSDATVYVKVVPNDNSTVNITNKNEGSDSPSSSTLDDNTTVYTIDGADEDVKVNLKNIEIQSIAVTNIFKEARMASASDETKFYNTDCQPKDIDYSLTNYYTGYDIKAMYITNENFGEFDYDRETAVVTPVEVTDPVKANTGLIIYTSDNEVLHPLFVPDVNTTARQSTEGNMLVGVIFGQEIATEGEETDETAEPTYTTSTETLYKYVATGGTAAQTLVDFASNVGSFTYNSTCTTSTVKIHGNKDDVTGIDCGNGFKTNANNVVVTCEGGFKAGDKISIAGVINNNDATKTGNIGIYDANGNNLFTTKLFINARTVTDDPQAEVFTLEADYESLMLGRASSDNATRTYITTFTVTRPGTPAEAEKVETDVTIYTGNVDPAESGTYRYLFTNQYNTVGKDNSLTSEEPGFYRLKADGGKLKSNRAYLVIGQSTLQGNKVKAIYLKNFFNDDPDDDFTTVIELVKDNNTAIDPNGTFYTLSGMRVQGLPTQKGIYIQNGKKIMVK